MAHEAAKYDKQQFEQFLKVRQLELTGKPLPSGFGRIWRPAETERKLVLFTLGIVVISVICGLLLYVATESSPSESVITSMTTLAGTGLGFIGGMVSSRRTEEEAENRTRK